MGERTHGQDRRRSGALTRVQRGVDRWLEGGDGRAILLLAGLAIAVAVISALLVLLFHARLFDGSGARELKPVDGFWQSLVRTIDPGQITADQGAGRVIGLFTTIVGLLLLSTLISLVGNVVERRVEHARRGRDPVELPRRRSARRGGVAGGSDDLPYYVVLGWSDLTLPLVSELARSHTGQDRPDVLVMSPRPVIEMRLAIDEYLERHARDAAYPPRPRHWPELRTGDPSDHRDLDQIVRLDIATSVVVLAPDPHDGPLYRPGGPDDLCPASAEVVKVAVAVTAVAADGEASADPLRMVVEIPENARVDRDLASRLKGRLGAGVPGGRTVSVLPVDMGRLQTHLAARVSRTAGLAAVYREVLDFKGCEFHLLANDGRSFGEAVQSVSGGVVVGTVHEDGGFSQPDWHSVPGRGENLVVLSDTGRAAVLPLRRSPPADPADPAGSPFGPVGRPVAVDTEPEAVLLLGWNHRGPAMIEALKAQLPDGSTITVVSDEESVPAGGRGRVTVTRRNPPAEGIQAWLDDPTNAPLLSCEHAVVLGCDELTPAVSDAGVLLTLLALNGSGTRSGLPDTVVAELRERPNRRLARRRFDDDLVVGDSLVASVLAQYTVTPDLSCVFDALIEHRGPTRFEFRFVPVPAGEAGPRTFADLQRWCWAGGVIALGFRLGAGTPQLNPGPAATVAPDGPDVRLEAIVLGPAGVGEVAPALVEVPSAARGRRVAGSGT